MKNKALSKKEILSFTVDKFRNEFLKQRDILRAKESGLFNKDIALKNIALMRTILESLKVSNEF